MDQLTTLTQLNLNDLVISFGWQNRLILARLLRRIAHYPARRFAELMIAFDDAVGERGLAEAARLSQRNYVRDIRLYSDPSTGSGSTGSPVGDFAGQRPLPAGPFLALSNHPGLTDTLSLFAALDRPDLRIIALDRAFLRALPNTSKQLYFVRDEAAARIGLVRQVTSHLRAGGAVLTFPAGHIEPDPDAYPGAVESLRSWTDSAGLFIRLAPETAVLPVLVRGVVWDKTARNPLLAFKKTRTEKETLAAAFQFLSQITLTIKPITVRVQVGKPIYARDLGTTETSVIHRAVLAEMQRLIVCPPEGPGKSVL